MDPQIPEGQVFEWAAEQMSGLADRQGYVDVVEFKVNAVSEVDNAGDTDEEWQYHDGRISQIRLYLHKCKGWFQSFLNSSTDRTTQEMVPYKKVPKETLGITQLIT